MQGLCHRGGAFGANVQIEGISSADWATFIGPSAPIYLSRMSHMQLQKRNISFLFSAFLFSPTYFAYRKMWGWAAATLAATFFFFLPQMLVIGATAGVMVLPNISLETLETINMVTSYISLALRLICGMFALYLYQRNGTKQIHTLQKAGWSQADYQMQLAKTGGVSMLGVGLILILMFVMMFAFISFCGNDFLNALVSFYYPGTTL